MELITILLAIIIITGIGYISNVLFVPNNQNVLLRLSLAYGIGFAVISYQMLFYDLLNIRWTGLSLFIPWIAPFFFVLIFRKKKLIPKIGMFMGSRSLVFIFAMLIILTFIQTIMRPVTAWDAIATWFIGGKSFFINRFIDPTFYHYANYDIPPFMPLMLTSVNLFSRTFNDTFSLIFYFLFYLSLLVLMYFMLREFLSSNKALLFTFLLGSTQNFIRHGSKFDIGNSDLPLAFYFLISIFFLKKYIENNKAGYLGLSLICLVSSGMIKNDGLPFAFLGTLILVIYILRRKNLLHLLLVPFFSFPIIYWKLFMIYYDLPGTIYFLSNFQIQRIHSVFHTTAKEFFNIQRWNLAWIFVMVSLLNLKNFRQSWPFGVLILFQFLAYILIYFITPIDSTKHIENSFDRLLLQILPITLFFVISLKKIKPTLKKE